MFNYFNTRPIRPEPVEGRKRIGSLQMISENYIYEADGKVRDVRPVGRYTSSQPGDAHHEGGGVQGCVLHYSVRGETDALFDVLDADFKVLATLRTSDFKAAFDAQTQA